MQPPLSTSLGFASQVHMKHLEMLLNFCASICLASFAGIGHVALPGLDLTDPMDGVAYGFDS